MHGLQTHIHTFYQVQFIGAKLLYNLACLSLKISRNRIFLFPVLPASLVSHSLGQTLSQSVCQSAFQSATGIQIIQLSFCTMFYNIQFLAIQSRVSERNVRAVLTLFRIRPSKKPRSGSDPREKPSSRSDRPWRNPRILMLKGRARIRTTGKPGSG